MCSSEVNHIGMIIKYPSYIYVLTYYNIDWHPIVIIARNFSKIGTASGNIVGIIVVIVLVLIVASVVLFLYLKQKRDNRNHLEMDAKEAEAAKLNNEKV